MTIFLAITYAIALVVIFYLLAKVCDDYFVDSLELIAEKLKLPHDVAGATLMAMGSSAPELFTSLIAIFTTAEEVGSGTIVGSAIFNVLVIVGGSAAVATAYLDWKPVFRDLGFYILAILLLLITFSDGTITFTESLWYLGSYALYIILLWFWRHWFPSNDSASTSAETQDIASLHSEPIQRQNLSPQPPISLFKSLTSFIDSIFARIFPNLNKNPDKYLLTFVISIFAIALLSWSMVEIAVDLAKLLGIPAVIISLTILAGGTSVPDLISSLIVARKGRGDMAVSNAVGSNTFDIFIGLGLPWLLYLLITGTDVTVGTENLLSSILLLFFTVIALLFLLILQRFKIGKKSGYFLVGLYIIYVIYKVLGVYFPEYQLLEQYL